MSLVPESIYPNYPRAIVDKNGEFAIGSLANGTYRFGDVKKIELDWDTVGDSDYATVTVLEFKNGYKLIGEFAYHSLTRYIDVNFRWTYNGNTMSAPPGTYRSSISLRYEGGTQYVSGTDLTHIYLFLSTNFGNDAVEGVTLADSVFMEMYFDTFYNRYIGVDLVTLHTNLDDKLVSYQGISRSRLSVDLYNGEEYRIDTNPQVGTFYPFGITDYNAFNTFMKGAGSGQNDDVFDPDPPSDKPAGSDDPSGPGGGKGNYDDSSDPIDFPDLPTGGALECGAVVAHRVSKQTLEAIMSKLWDGSIFNILNMWQKSISDPMDAIVSLHAIPVSPEVNGPTAIWIGNFDTELTSPLVTSQYVEVDCGTLNIKEYWGSALDYSPYTRAEIFLPFIGIKDVSIEDVMNNTLHIKYHVDVLTGDCIAFIKCGISVLYHFTGNCRMTIPLSSYSTDALQNTIGATGKMLTSAAIGGAVGGGAGAFAGTAISSAATVASSKIRLSKGNGLSGGVSLMDDFTPYVIIHRPVQSLAKNYNKFKGYPSNITATLGNLRGYTEVEHVHLQDIPNATSAEMDEIKSLLKGGVIL